MRCNLKLYSRKIHHHWLLVALLALTSCGPSIECSNKIDGKNLLNSLYEKTTPLDKLAQDIVPILSSCRPSSEQKDLINQAVNRIAVNGQAATQADFYKQISTVPTANLIRIKFIKESTLFNGKLLEPVQKLKFVQFNAVGHQLNPQEAPVGLLKALKQSAYNLQDSSARENLRVISTNDNQVLLALNTYSYHSTFGLPAEKSEIEFFGLKEGIKYSVPKSEYRYGNEGKKDAFMDYLSETDVNTDTRYAVDGKGQVKYVVKIQENINNDLCTKHTEISEFKKSALIVNLQLSESTNIECDSIVADERHDPFSNYTEKDLLPKLATISTFDLVDFINFTRKDAADNDLRKTLQAQGNKWDASFISKIPISSISYKVRSVSEAFKYQVELLDQASESTSLLKWVYSETEVGRNMAEDLKLIDMEIKRLKFTLKQTPRLPEPIKPEKYFTDVVNSSFALARQIPPNNLEGIPILNEHPYTYLAVTLYNNQYAIIRSHRALAEQSSIVNLNVHKGESPMKYLVGDWIKDVWNYSEVTDDEQQQLDKYNQDNRTYELKLRQYLKNDADLAKKMNELQPQIQNVLDSINKLTRKI